MVDVTFINEKMNQKKACVEPILLNLTPESDLNTESCSRMVTGIIKHILYHREQIPEPFDQLVKLCSKCSSTTERVKSFSDAKMKQRQNQIGFITKVFTDLFSNLDNIFQRFDNTRIRRIVVLLGATILTPREIHSIELPPQLVAKQENSVVSHSASSDRSITQMFRNLFIKSNCKTWPYISPTNITVFVLMRRECNNDWFLPKACYALPRCSSEIVYKLTPSFTASLQTPSNELKNTEPYTCLSPFAVYESPMTSTQSGKVGQQNSYNMQTNNLNELHTDTHSNLDDDGDYIWFQMPVSAKGILNQ